MLLLLHLVIWNDYEFTDDCPHILEEPNASVRKQSKQYGLRYKKGEQENLISIGERHAGVSVHAED